MTTELPPAECWSDILAPFTQIPAPVDTPCPRCGYIEPIHCAGCGTCWPGYTCTDTCTVRISAVYLRRPMADAPRDGTYITAFTELGLDPEAITVRWSPRWQHWDTDTGIAYGDTAFRQWQPQ